MHLMDSVGKISYIEAIINSNRELYEQIFLYQLENLKSPIPNIDFTTFEEFKKYMQRDMMCMMGIVSSKFKAQLGVIEKVQGGVDASIYDEEEDLMDNLCRDGTQYVDKDEEVEDDDDADGDQEDDDWVDCDDDDDDDDIDDDGDDRDVENDDDDDNDDVEGIAEKYRQILSRVGL
jgi:hypothetical protein